MRNSGTVGGKVNTPYKNLDFEGLTTNTTKVNVDNANRTISVDLLKEYAEQSDFNNLSGEVTNISGEVAVIAEEVAKKVNIAEIDLNDLMSENELYRLNNRMGSPQEENSDNFWFDISSINILDYKDCQTIKVHYKAVDYYEPEEEIVQDNDDGKEALEECLNDFVISGIEIPLPSNATDDEAWASGIYPNNNDDNIVDLDDVKGNCVNAWYNEQISDFWRYRDQLSQNGWSVYYKGSVNWYDDFECDTYEAYKGNVIIVFGYNYNAPEFELAVFDNSRRTPVYCNDSYLYFDRNWNYDSEDVENGDEWCYFVYKDPNNIYQLQLGGDNIWFNNISNKITTDITESLSYRDAYALSQFIAPYEEAVCDRQIITTDLYCYLSNFDRKDTWDKSELVLWYYAPEFYWATWAANPYDDNCWRESSSSDWYEDDDGNHCCAFTKYSNTEYNNLVKYSFYPDIDCVSGNIKSLPSGYEDYYSLEENGDYITFCFYLDEDCAGRIYLEGIKSDFYSSDNYNATYVDSDNNLRMEIRVNGDSYWPESKYMDKSYGFWFGREYDSNNFSNDGFLPWADAVEFKKGYNEIIFYRTASRSIAIKSITLVLEEGEYKPHKDNWGDYDKGYYCSLNFIKSIDFDDEYYNKYVCDNMDGYGWTKSRLVISPDSAIVGTKEANVPLSIPNDEWNDDRNLPEDAGKAIVLSYNYYGDNNRYSLVYSSFQAPIGDLDQIRYNALYSINNNAKSYVKSRISSSINDLYANENTWDGTNYFRGAVYFSGPTFFDNYNQSTYIQNHLWTFDILPSYGSVPQFNIGSSSTSTHFKGVYANTLYGADVTNAATASSYGKPISQIVLSGELSTAISALSSVYAPITTVSELSSAFSAISSLQTSVASCVTSATLNATLQSYATVAALDEYGATEVLSDSFISIFDYATESSNIVTDLRFDSTIYSMIYSLASLSSAKLVKQRLEILTNDRPILLDRFTVNSSSIYCDLNYTGQYGKAEGIANFYSVSGSNFCELDTTYGVYNITKDWE